MLRLLAHGFRADEGSSHRLFSSSFLGTPYRILNKNTKRNYLGAYGRGFWVCGLVGLVEV